MGIPLGLVSGAWFALFGGAVLVWCVNEVRLRRTLLHGEGARAVARVLAEHPEEGQSEDPAPILGFDAGPPHGEVVIRPRGWTTVRRTPVLPADTLVQVAYDPADPHRAVVDGVRQARADLLWVAVGSAFLVGGVLLLIDTFGGF